MDINLLLDGIRNEIRRLENEAYKARSPAPDFRARATVQDAIADSGGDAMRRLKEIVAAYGEGG